MLQGEEHRGQGVPVDEPPQPADARKPASAASEERLLSSAEEFAASASKTTVFLTNLLQGLLVACVVLWVLDVPRQVFNISFYTEQLLTVCLGLTLALAFVTEAVHKPRSFEWSGVFAALTIGVYVVYSYKSPTEIPLAVVVGFVCALVWTAIAGRPWAARWFDWASAFASLMLCGYIAVRYE